MRIPEPVLAEDFYMVKRIGGDVTLPAPRTRFEKLLYIYAGGTIERPTPKTVEERFLDYITGGESELPVPKTRLQSYMYNVANPSNKIPVVPPKTRFECYWFVMATANSVISHEFRVEFTSVEGFLLDYTIWGNTEQDGVPTPEEPIEPKSVGNKQAPYGYKIPITFYGSNNNLFTATDLSYGEWYDGNGTNLTNTIYSVMSDYLPVSSAQYYVKMLGTPPFSFEVVWFDHNKDFIARYYRASPTTQVYVCNAANGSAFFRIGLSCRTSQQITEDYVIDCNLFLTIPNKSTANIYINEPLRKIGDYADYVDFEKQQIIKNVSVVNFTGEEEWHVQENAYFTYIAHTTSETPPTLCSAFSLSTSESVAVGEYRLGGIDSWDGNVLFNYDDGAGGVDNFKSYLGQQYANGTPVKFYYPCVAPITELIELPKIPTSDGTNIIDVGTEVQPSKIEIVTRTE